MIAIGYVRVSSEKQVEDGVSLAVQREKIEAYAKLYSADLLEVCADEGLSGKRADNRPGLQRALKLVCENNGTLIVYSLSRLARSTRDAIDIADKLKRCGAQLASVTEKLDTSSSMGGFFFTIMAALGELERRQIAERTQAGMDHKRKKGERIGKIPFGYDVAADGVKLVPNAAEQTTIKLIRQLRADGYTFQELADKLNRDKVRTKTGAPWGVKVVWSICKAE